MMMVMGGECLVAAPSGCVCASLTPTECPGNHEPGSTGLAGLSRGTGKGREERCLGAPGQGPGSRDRQRGQETSWSGGFVNCL